LTTHVAESDEADGEADAVTASRPEEFQAENRHAAVLVHAAARGDRNAEAELIRIYDRRVLVKLRQHLPEAEVVLDLRQEVWLRIVEALRGGGIQQPERFCGFLLGTVRNVMRERVKANRRSPVPLDDVPEPIADGTDAEQFLDEDWRAEQVRHCLSELGDRDREILVRHYLREDDKRMTCEVLGLSSLNYNNVLHRARQRLAELVDRNRDAPATAPRQRALR
jgi:RNA polymerase sigma factor (sigma-70 family)